MSARPQMYCVQHVATQHGTGNGARPLALIRTGCSDSLMLRLPYAVSSGWLLAHVLSLIMSSLSVYLDADVLIAGAASPNAYSAAQVVLTLSEITLLDAITSTLTVTECRHNIEAKFERSGEVRERFDHLIARAVDVVEAPSPEQVRRYAPYADWKDVPHLMTAAQHRCRYLVTYNVADYNVEDYKVEDVHRQGASHQEDDSQQRAQGLAALHVIQPGPLVRTVRAQLAGL